MDFLWVRWFSQDLSHRSGFEVKRLHHLGFLPSDNVDVFGFLDPNIVV